MTYTAAADAGTTIDTGGTQTFYYDLGPRDGSPVLLLHGSGPGVSAWANWRLTMGPLANAGHRVLALDFVGFGATKPPADVYYSLENWAKQAFAFMDAVGIDKAGLIGNSLGGRICLEMAQRHPERIDRMVLMGSPGPGMTPTKALTEVRQYQPSEAEMRRLLEQHFAYDPSIITDDLVRTRYEASVADGAHETYSEMFTDKHGATALGITEEEVREIGTRTLVVHGRDDVVIPMDLSVNMARLLPDADLAVVARCGHWTQIERADTFNSLVADFFSGMGGTT